MIGEKVDTEKIMEMIDIEPGDWKQVLAKQMTRHYVEKHEKANLEYEELAFMGNSYFDGILDTLRLG